MGDRIESIVIRFGDNEDEYLITKTLTDNTYTVWKDGNAEPYTVLFKRGKGHKISCTCAQWQYRRKPCRHMEMVRNHIRNH